MAPEYFRVSLMMDYAGSGVRGTTLPLPIEEKFQY